MKTRSTPDEKVVYLALRKILTGPEAKLRQPRAILKLIEKYQEQLDVANLIRTYNIDAVCNTVRTLLAEEIFESTLKAKNRFPELFAPSTAKGPVRQAPKAETARLKEGEIRDTAQHRQESIQEGVQIGWTTDTGGGKRWPLDAVELTTKKLPVIVETCVEPIYPTANRSNHMPPLYPAYLPFRTQHRVLTKVQLILEQACFEFAQQAMPEVLIRRQWDCPESAELDAWAKEFLKHRSQFASKDTNIANPLDNLYRSIINIRHTVVHRLRVSAKEVEEFIHNAELLATLLGDKARLSLLTKFRQHTQSTIEELERNKHILSSKLVETLESITMQRAGLNHFEKAAISEIAKEDTEYQMIAGAKLEQAVESLEASV